MTDQDRDNEEFAWVRRAYLETPAPALASVEAAKLAMRAQVVPAQMMNPVSTLARGSHARRLPAWRPWQPAVAVMAAVGVIVVLWMKDYGSSAVPVSRGVAGPSLAESRPASVAADSASRTSVSLGIGVLGKRDGSSINRQAHEQTAPTTAHVPLHGSMSPGPGSPALQSASAVASPTPGSRMDSITGADALAPSSVASVRPKNSGQPVLSPTSPVSAHAVEGLDAESAVLVRRVLDSASARGLPVVALALRVREGVRRGVPGPRIVVVTRNFAAALGDASTTLGPSASSTEIQAGAGAMVAGAPASALRQIRTARSSGSIAGPLVALADLTTYGVAPLQASTALAALMVHDRSDVSVQALRARVVSDILQGTPPNAALADRVRQAVPLDPPRSQAPFSSGGVEGLRDSATRSRPTP